MARLTRELTESLERQTATADILQIIANSPSDVQPVFDAVADRAMRLLDCWSVIVLRFDGELVHFGAARGALPDTEHVVRKRFTSMRPDRAGLIGRSLLDRAVVNCADAQAEPDRELQDYARKRGLRAVLVVPLLREDRVDGALVLTRAESGLFAEREVELVKAFADQAVIAIENARLFNETKEALERQSATSDVLRAIGSSMADSAPVFETILDSCEKLFQFSSAGILLIEGNQKLLQTARGPGTWIVRSLFPQPMDLTLEEAFRDKRPVYTANVAESTMTTDSLRLAAEKVGGYALLQVPMFWQGRGIGAISVSRPPNVTFSDREVALLTTFADQAVIAIENARLFNETQEALQQQTATAEVLQVISNSPGELGPVFKMVLENATRLCDARFGTVHRFDGNAFYFAADVGTPAPLAEYMRRPGPLRIPQGGMLDRILKTRQMQHTPDYAADAVPGLGATLGGARSTLGVPILRDEVLVGAIVIYRQEVRPFSGREIDLVRSFAAQAAIAIENARLFNETQEALARQTASADILRVISVSPTDVQPVFDAIVRTAVRLLGCDRAFFLRVDGRTYTAVAGVGRDGPVPLSEPNRPIDPAANFPSRAIATKQILHLPDWAKIELPEFERGIHERFAVNSSLYLPLLRGDDCIGLLVLVGSQPNMFGEAGIALAESFRDQALIAIENTRLFNETQEALERQTATSEVLSIINSSPDDLKTVFDAMVEKARRLCGADSGHLVLPVGDDFRVAAISAMSPELEAKVRAVTYTPGRGTAVGRSLAERRVVQIADINMDSEHALRHTAGSMLFRTILGVPLLREGEPIGAFGLARWRVEPFTERQIQLVETFAAQAVIAIENTRLFNETKEALSYQTGSSNVLRVIASSPADVAPVLEAIVESARELCEADDAIVLLKDGDHLRFNAHAGPIPVNIDKWPIGPGWTAGLAFLDKKPVHVHDMISEEGARFPDARAMGQGTGAAIRTVLSVPLVRGSESIGAILLRRAELRPFSQKQINLLSTFADQAVIAIQNANLFNETQEALERQTATADILKVIASSPSDVQPVFEAIATRANSLVGGFSATVFRFIDGMAHLMAFTPTTPEADDILKSTFPSPVESFAPFKMARDGDVTQVPDTETLTDEILDISRARGFRSMLFAPLMNKGASIGLIAVTRLQPGTFSDHHVQMLRTFADQAVIAIENVRLFEEVQAKTHDLEESLQQQTATAEVLKVISRSAFDLQTVLETLTRSAVELSGARRGVIFLRDGELFRFRASSYADLYPDWVEFLKDNPPRAGHHSAIARAISSGRTVCIADVSADPEIKMPAALAGIRAVLAVPLLRDGKVEGVMALSRQVPGDFADRQIELVQTFADQAVIAIENARLFEEVQARTRELAQSLDDLRTAQDRLVQTEKLASLGQLTAGIAHEIKNPLNFVNNFSALSGDLIDELNDLLGSAAVDAKVRAEIDELTRMLKGNLDKVVQHGKRADSIVKNMLLHSREGSGERRAADINAIVEESLNLAYHGARAEKSGFNITLQRDLDPAAGIIALYPQEITRVLLNLISNGFYAANKRREAGDAGFEPILTAATKDLGHKVEIRIRDNGTGIPAEVKEKMFNPFFTTKPAGEGTGLGLSMSHDIVVKQHGGKIEVDTEPGRFTEFIITLPRTAAKGHAGERN